MLEALTFNDLLGDRSATRAYSPRQDAPRVSAWLTAYARIRHTRACVSGPGPRPQSPGESCPLRLERWRACYYCCPIQPRGHENAHSHMRQGWSRIAFVWNRQYARKECGARVVYIALCAKGTSILNINANLYNINNAICEHANK